METTKTQAERLIEMAAWLKKQGNDFTKHFPSVRSISAVYNRLPQGYDRKTKLSAYIKRLAKGDAAEKRAAGWLALGVNAAFGFRYFDCAPRRYKYTLRLREWTTRTGENKMEVRMSCYDQYEEMKDGDCSITINTLGDAKRAVIRLLESECQTRPKEEFDVTICPELKKAMAKKNASDAELIIYHDITSAIFGRR